MRVSTCHFGIGKMSHGLSQAMPFVAPNNKSFRLSVIFINVSSFPEQMCQSVCSTHKHILEGSIVTFSWILHSIWFDTFHCVGVISVIERFGEGWLWIRDALVGSNSHTAESNERINENFKRGKNRTARMKCGKTFLLFLSWILCKFSECRHQQSYDGNVT